MIDKQRLDAHMANGKTEFVMCAANWHDDGIEYMFQPYNIATGYIISGWRHPCAGEVYMATHPEEKSWSKCKEGFLTTKNRFLTRAESLELVKENGQLKQDLIGGVLTSEDLW